MQTRTFSKSIFIIRIYTREYLVTRKTFSDKIILENKPLSYELNQCKQIYKDHIEVHNNTKRV